MPKSNNVTTLEVVLSERALRLMAGAASFDRGCRYATEHRVKQLKVTDIEISCRVMGSMSYDVRVWTGEGFLGYSCTCPMGQADAFCKHCVAAGLVWLGRGRTDPPTTGKIASRDSVDLRTFLLGCDKDALVDLLVERTDSDELFEAKLRMLATTVDSATSDLDPYRRAIERAIVVDRFVDYRSMYDYSSNVSDAVRTIEDLLKSNHAEGAMELSEYALECLEDALGRVDDSDGYLGEIREQLIELHHDACEEAHPDPEELAKRLFDWAIHSEWETFLDSVDRYADVLGERGLARYRSLAERVWESVLPAGQDDADHYGLQFRITFLMESLARIAGSVDEQVAIKARDLTYAYHYVEIVDLLADAERFDLALEWAERGLRAFPDHTDVRLREVAAREFHRAGRDSEAMALVWMQLEERPTCDSYELLMHHGTATGTWKEWRQRALKLLHDRENRMRSASPGKGASERFGARSRPAWRHFDKHPASSELVKVHLLEGDPGAAWAQAESGGCSPSLWLQLASLREIEHPGDVIPIYQEEVEREIAEKKNRSYQTAVALMKKVQSLMVRVGEADQFASYSASVRTTHRAKRNLVKLLDEQRW